jgi:hypothetical protein
MRISNKYGLLGLMLTLAAILVIAAGSGQAWAGKWKKESERHKSECKAWCGQTPGCEFCSTNRGCGQGYEAIRSWTGYGKNWHACAKRETRREAGLRHKEDCEKWCRENPACSDCTSVAGCGYKSRVLKTWKGRGKNYYACERRMKTDRASMNNKAACEEWCGRHEKCRKCTNFTTCGLGVRTLKTFGGAGENWYACEK